MLALNSMLPRFIILAILSSVWACQGPRQSPIEYSNSLDSLRQTLPRLTQLPTTEAGWDSLISSHQNKVALPNDSRFAALYHKPEDESHTYIFPDSELRPVGTLWDHDSLWLAAFTHHLKGDTGFRIKGLVLIALSKSDFQAKSSVHLHVQITDGFPTLTTTASDSLGVFTMVQSYNEPESEIIRLTINPHNGALSSEWPLPRTAELPGIMPPGAVPLPLSYPSISPSDIPDFNMYEESLSSPGGTYRLSPAKYLVTMCWDGITPIDSTTFHEFLPGLFSHGSKEPFWKMETNSDWIISGARWENDSTLTLLWKGFNPFNTFPIREVVQVALPGPQL